MSRKLHHRQRDDKYNVWSTIVDDYVYEWDTKENIKKQWLMDMILTDMEKIEDYMKKIDEEIW